MELQSIQLYPFAWLWNFLFEVNKITGASLLSWLKMYEFPIDLHISHRNSVEFGSRDQKREISFCMKKWKIFMEKLMFYSFTTHSLLFFNRLPLFSVSFPWEPNILIQMYESLILMFIDQSIASSESSAEFEYIFGNITHLTMKNQLKMSASTKNWFENIGRCCVYCM